MPAVHRQHTFASLAILLWAAAAFLLNGCTWLGTPTAKGPKSASVMHATGAAVTVDTRNGSVELVAEHSRPDVQIDAAFTCAGGTQEEANQRLSLATIEVSRDTSRALFIKPSFPGGPRNGDGASLVVRLPDAASVTVTASNGKVVVQSTGAALGGALSVKTSNAPIVVSGFNGPANLMTSNGSVTVTSLAGNLVVRTSNAPVQADAIAGQATIDTSNGSITLALDSSAAGPIMLDTSNGPIRVTVGSAFRGEATMTTSNGSVNISGSGAEVHQTSKSAAVARFADGEGSRIKSSNGSITFTVAP